MTMDNLHKYLWFCEQNDIYICTIYCKLLEVEKFYSYKTKLLFAGKHSQLDSSLAWPKYHKLSFFKPKNIQLGHIQVKIFLFLARKNQIFLYIINLQTYIVEYGNYTELQILWLSKMQPTLWY